MKKILLFILMGLCCGQLFAQTRKTDTTKQLDDATKNAINNNSLQGKGDDRVKFPVLLSGFINLLGTDGKNDIIINPTLYSIFGKDISLKDVHKYRKESFLRNVSLTFGITPDSKNQLQVDGGLWGVKWIIINNKILSINDYKKLSNNPNVSLVAKVQQYVMKLPHGKEIIQKYLNSADTVNTIVKDKDSTVKTILHQVVKKFNVDSLAAGDLINGYYSLKADLQDKLNTKSALFISYNKKYDFLKEQVKNIVLSSDYSFFIGKIPFDLTGTFTMAADSTQKNSSLVRHILEFDFGKNITFSQVKWFELKPALDYIYTQGPLYKKEKEHSYGISVTPRFMINKNFWLPITLKYDEQGLFGFLSVQYSLK